MNRARDIRNRLRELESELARISAIPDLAKFKAGTVISYRRSFEGGSTSYHYAAIKASNDLWYVTDRLGSRLTDEAMRELLATVGIQHVKVARKWLEIDTGPVELEEQLSPSPPIRHWPSPEVESQNQRVMERLGELTKRITEWTI